MICFLIYLVSLTSCQKSVDVKSTETPTITSLPYPAATQDTYPIAVPLSFQNNAPAFAGYELAAAHAIEKWNSKAVLYAIPDTITMQQNLGHPLIRMGWFYMFKTGEDTLEYYVYVDEGKIQGSTEAQPIIIGDPPPKDEPLPELKSLIDSPKALEIFFENGGNNKVPEADREDIHIALANLVADGIPTWHVYYYDETRNETFSVKINAITGEVLSKE